MAQAQANTNATGDKKVLAAKIYSTIMADKKIDEKGKRQAFLKEAVEKAGLTASGASTYFANFKNGNWTVAVTKVARATTAKPAATKATTASKPKAQAATKKPAKPAVTKPAAAKKPAAKPKATETANA